MPRMFEDYQRERRARIACWLSQRIEADIAAAVCERWVDDVVDSGRELHSRDDIPALPTELSLLRRLSDLGLHAYADALVWQIDGGEGIEPAEAPLIGYALAVASGRAYAAHGPAKLQWIGCLVSTIDGQAWEPFADSAALALSENADQYRAFVEFLTEIIEEANDAPDSLTEILPHRTSMASIVEQYARTGSFQEVWQADFWPVLFRWSDAFEILRRTNPDRFLDLIDELPHPALVKQCLNSRALTENPGDVTRLLRLAHASFDADGRWQSNGMAAILLLQLAGDQLLSAANTPGSDADATDLAAGPAGSQAAEEAEDLAKGIAQFRATADDLLDTLFARPDGVELGWHWLENLLRQLPRHRSPAAGHSLRKLTINHIGILVHALSSRLTPRRVQEAWITDAEPLVRQYRAVAVLCVAAFSISAGDLDIRAIAQALLKRNCFELTRASELIHLPGAPLRIIPGDVLARVPDVASWFTQTWSGLRLERERAWRRASARDGVDPNPAEIMAIWGLGVLESLSTNETQRSDPHAMWHALEAAFREARLVEPRMARDFWSLAVARLFGWWPRLFLSGPKLAMIGPEAASGESAALGAALGPYVGITDDFMGIIVSLRQAGIGVTMLDHALSIAGQDLLWSIQRFFQMARGLKDVRLWNQAWVSNLRSIETAIVTQRLGSEGKPARS